MCGIAGVVSPDPGARARAPAMAGALRHRGPDDEGAADFPRASLAHRRLSIIDLEGGDQPMRDASGDLCVVYNGEIYNYRELRDDLRSDGAVFRTDSDTEVLLHLYERRGAACVEALEGMFAFGLWDDRSGRLLLARDHMGQKPLFWIETDEGFAFASEVKGLLAGGWVAPDLDVGSLYDYLSLRCLPGDRTLFRSVRQLPAAHRLVHDRDGTRVERYWSFRFGDPPDCDEREMVERLDDVLRRTVERHLVADVEVGAFLSGGIDSSLITAYAAGARDHPLPTFAIGVREASFNELPFARAVAERFGTDHHERVVSADLVGRLPAMVSHLEEPADPYAVGVFLASGLASEHVKVVLSGDGGDELFAGYDRFVGQRLAEIYALVPEALRGGPLRSIIRRIPESFGYKSIAQRLRWLDAMAERDGAERYAHAMSFLRFDEDRKAGLFTPEALSRVEGDSRRWILEPFRSEHAEDVVDRMLYTDLVTRIPGHLLPIVDRTAMAHGLEVRVPFLEHRFVEFAARIPAGMKLRRRRLKHVLREVAGLHLPREIVEREKQGFGFPLGHWFRDDLRPVLERAVEESRLVEAGVFRRTYLRRLADEHLEGRQDHSYRLWLLVALEVWHRLFLEGRDRAEVARWLDERPAGERAAAAS